MPKRYEGIKKSVKKRTKLRGKALKSKAAQIFIGTAGPPGSKARSDAAKRLHDK